MLDIVTRYFPAGMFAAGTAAMLLVGLPKPTPLRMPLSAAAPAQFLGAESKDVAIGSDEVTKSGVSDYINKVYTLSPTEGVSLYVGYHATQQGDKQMHSPTLCLPGSGWTPVAQQVVAIPVGGKQVNVNRFVLQMGANRILVYYWFQGRGQLTTGQGALKLASMWNALVTHRDEEALVRIIVPMPIGDSTSAAAPAFVPDSVAAEMAAVIIPPLNAALPSAPGA